MRRGKCTVIKKIMMLIALVMVLLGVPIIAKMLTNLFGLTPTDPNNAFLWLMVRHTIQALIIILLMIFFKKTINLDFKLGLGNTEIGLNYLKKFMIIFSIGCISLNTIMLLLDRFQPFEYAYTVKSIVGHLSFQLLFSGPSEEIIFRSFSITIFMHFISKKRLKRNVTYANLFALIVFGLAHISITISPFSMSFLLPQVITSMVMGYFYGDCFEKSESVIYPMIMHSLSNVLIVGLSIIFTGIFNL